MHFNVFEFRCSMHDRSVGGDSTEQHTKRNAVDVCCKVQDICFGGIANITPAYIYRQKHDQTEMLKASGGFENDLAIRKAHRTAMPLFMRIR